MNKKIRNSIIVFLLAGLLLEVSGNGLIGIAQCSDSYRLKRCLSIGNDTPEEMMSDFFQLIEANELNLAWNLLSNNMKNYFQHMDDGVDGKNYFYNFWDIEIDSFQLGKMEKTPLGKNTAKIKINVCYKRNLAYAEKNSLETNFCSDDYYTLILKKNDANSPYLWSIDTFCWDNCMVENSKNRSLTPPPTKSRFLEL